MITITIIQTIKISVTNIILLLRILITCMIRVMAITTSQRKTFQNNLTMRVTMTMTMGVSVVMMRAAVTTTSRSKKKR